MKYKKLWTFFYKIKSKNNPTKPMVNYNLLDDIMFELARKLKNQQQQDILASVSKSYLKNH